MKTLLAIALLLPVSAAVAGEWVVQPQPDGTLRMLHEAPSKGGSPDTLALRQPANKTLTVQVSPAGRGRCEQGDLVVETLRFPLQALRGGKKVVCGEVFSWLPDASDQISGIRAVNRAFKHERFPARRTLPPRSQFGTVTFRLEGETSPTVFPLWLDLTALENEVATLEATFDSASVSFGKVSELRDNVAHAHLKIKKDQAWGNASLPYIVRLESARQRNNGYYLTTSDGKIAVPYYINLAGKEIFPDTKYRGTIPVGPAEFTVMDLTLLIKGKSLQGLAANTKLADTLTAVITPAS